MSFQPICRVAPVNSAQVGSGKYGLPTVCGIGADAVRLGTREGGAIGEVLQRCAVLEGARQIDRHAGGQQKDGQGNRGDHGDGRPPVAKNFVS